MCEHSEHKDIEKKHQISPEEIKKILTRAKVQIPSESPKFISSPSSGVKSFSIQGRFEHERSRLGPSFNESDRQWRVKFLESQNLHPSEPFDVPELSKVNYNIFRRIYRFPLNMFENFLCNYMKRSTANVTRTIIGRTLMGYYLILIFWYYLKYDLSNWENHRGLRIFYKREAVFPGDVRWPMANPRTESWQHYDRKFHERKVFLPKD